jgi:hypothetical protein
MALIHCRECGREVSDQAASCPGCGYPLKDKSPLTTPGGLLRSLVYEYKSPRTIFGLPLLHIVYGFSGAGMFKPAKGFIAIGNVAIGVIAIGGLAVGGITIAGIGLGIFCLAGLAFGIAVGVGGIATGYLALGGIAIGTYAVGGLAIGAHTPFNDPQLRESLRKIFHFLP